MCRLSAWAGVPVVLDKRLTIGCSKTFAALSAMGAGGPIAGWINEGLKDRGTSVSLAQTSRRFLQRT